MNFKNILAMATILFSVGVFAGQVNVNCTSSGTNVSGTITVADDNSVSGTLNVNGTNSEISGNYFHFAAGEYCAQSPVKILSIVAKSAKVAVKSIRGDSCENIKDGDVIYVNGQPKAASCAIQ
jgi:hypothetical protein